MFIALLCICCNVPDDAIRLKNTTFINQSMSEKAGHLGIFSKSDQRNMYKKNCLIPSFFFYYYISYWSYSISYFLTGISHDHCN
jgi:hypothetical protein